MVGQSRMTAKHGESERRQKKKKKGEMFGKMEPLIGSASVVVGGKIFPGHGWFLVRGWGRGHAL